jgi:hypothetical protein
VAEGIKKEKRKRKVEEKWKIKKETTIEHSIRVTQVTGKKKDHINPKGGQIMGNEQEKKDPWYKYAGRGILIFLILCFYFLCLLIAFTVWLMKLPFSSRPQKTAQQV